MEQAGRALLVQSMKSIVRDPRRVQAFFLAVQLRLFPPPVAPAWAIYSHKAIACTVSGQIVRS